jgi:hypothetical protein
MWKNLTHGDHKEIARIAEIAEIENRNVKEITGAKTSDGS